MDAVRFGEIGLGDMGSVNTRRQQAAVVAGGMLSAVCDQELSRLEGFAPEVACCTDPAAVLARGKVDAVIVAAPHFSHVPLGIAALEAGLRLLVEKILTAHKTEALR